MCVCAYGIVFFFSTWFHACWPNQFGCKLCTVLTRSTFEIKIFGLGKNFSGSISETNDEKIKYSHILLSRRLESADLACVCACVCYWCRSPASDVIEKKMNAEKQGFEQDGEHSRRSQNPVIGVGSGGAAVDGDEHRRRRRRRPVCLTEQMKRRSQKPKVGFCEQDVNVWRSKRKVKKKMHRICWAKGRNCVKWRNLPSWRRAKYVLPKRAGCARKLTAHKFVLILLSLGDRSVVADARSRLTLWSLLLLRLLKWPQCLIRCALHLHAHLDGASLFFICFQVHFIRIHSWSTDDHSWNIHNLR